MSDEIKQRLQDSADKCLKAYEEWRKDEKSDAMREGLQEAVHEMRKVASRLEIELAISERDQMRQKPIPIPPHRNAKGKNRNTEDDDSKGNKNDDVPAKPKAKKKEPSEDTAE